ncbi:MAG: hypothetical protein LBU67_08710 [Oscillospiraceae bacterium]|jgi:hypothetical protein|nr:hypothetical protein [Oscillospiraceae bacterium]
MSKLTYLLRRARRMDWAAMARTAAALHKKTGKPRLWLLWDMVLCALRFGAGYVDYKIAEMYRLTPAQRATHITRGTSNRIVARMNDKAYWHFFDNKAEFNALFARQVRRGWIDLAAATDAGFAAFLAGRGPVIAKPLDGSSGQGIQRVEPGEFGDPAALRARLLGEGIGIVEDCVTQHPAMAALCPTSVNTLRVATLLGDRKQGVVYAYIRIGNGKVMDNVDCGGMAAPIDLETGLIRAAGADKQGNAYEKHPITGAVIPGTAIPFWQEAVAMCLAASQVVPQVRFVAWDVAITPDGPVFIEGNSFPSHAIPQFAAHFPDGIGILPKFKEFIDL